jgi:hypothetical protein
MTTLFSSSPEMAIFKVDINENHMGDGSTIDNCYPNS